MGKPAIVARTAGFVLLAVAVVATVTLLKDQLAISAGTWLLFLGLAIYVHYSLTKLTERIGLEQLPSLSAMLDHKARAPIVPRHEASEGIPPEGWGVTEEVHQFHMHFLRFADVMNSWLEETPWRLQEVADTEVGTLEDTGPVYGRRWQIYHGPRIAGRISLSEGTGYSIANPLTHVSVEVYEARIYNAGTLTELLDGVAAHVAGNTTSMRAEARQQIRNAMIEAVWGIGPEVVTNSTLVVRLSGSAEWYLRKVGLFSEASDANQ